MKTIRVVTVTPGAGKTTVETIMVENTLEALQKAIGGGYLEAVGFGRGLHLYCDEDGISKELPLVAVIHGHRIHGQFLISKRDSEGEEIGLSEEEAARAVEQLKGPS